VYLALTIPDTDILLLGSKNPFPLDLERARRRLTQQEIREDLADPRVGIRSIYDLASRILMGPDEVRRFVGSGPLHTDDLPIIAYNAPRDLYRNTRKENMRLLTDYTRGIGPYVNGFSVPPENRKRFSRLLTTSYRSFLNGGQEDELSERPSIVK
jgi:hypothetical protein